MNESLHVFMEFLCIFRPWIIKDKTTNMCNRAWSIIEPLFLNLRLHQDQISSLQKNQK